MKPHKLSLLLIFLTFNIGAQEFDDTYLDSLPEDIRDDVLEQSKINDKSAAPEYRASKFSSKLQKDELLLELKLRIEDDLEELERRLSSEDEVLKISDELKIFGSDFFKTVQTTFMPINEPNIDSDYILDFGDVIDIQLVGQESSSDSYQIERDGSISLKDIGKIIIAGLSLDQASVLIKEKVVSAFIGTEAYITISFIRDVNILISGNSNNPGIYTLSGNSNILHALFVSGGINEYGSYREIDLIRNGNVIEKLDLYDLLINGKYTLSKRLRSGDVVHVNAVKNIVTIDGAVKRPAKYELNDGQSLNYVINYANGLNIKADYKNIYLERILDNSLQSLPILNINQFDAIKANDGDMIYIREIPYKTAKIEGAVLKPGTYLMSPGDTIYDLVDKAGGYLDNAYEFGAVYENKNALQTNKLAKETLYNEFLISIVEMSQQLSVEGNFDFAPIVKLTQDLKNTKPNGRVVIDLSNNQNSVAIKDGDRLIIPEITNHVYVYGEVSTEGAVLYDPDSNDLEYYVKKSGGYKRLADNQAIYILHPNGETQRYSKKRNIFAFQPHEVEIYPGSIIFIPKQLNDSAARRLAAQAYVSILGNIGIALASLSAISDN